MIDLEYRAGTIVIRTRTGPVLTSEVLEGLSAAVTYAGTDHPIVLTGVGGVFASDLDPVNGPGRTRALTCLRRVLSELRAHPLPVVAAINGDAVGAGYLLAEVADARVMSGGFLQPSSRSAVSYCAKTAVTVGLVEHQCPAAELIDFSLRQISRLRRSDAHSACLEWACRTLGRSGWRIEASAADVEGGADDAVGAEAVVAVDVLE